MEIYSVEQEEIQITLSHVPFIDAAAVDSHNPDIIIGQDINSTAIAEQLFPINPPAYIYPALSGPPGSGEETFLVPLAFTLPLVMGRQDAVNKLPDPILVRREDILQSGQDFAKRDKQGRLIVLGFSPTWNPSSFVDFLFLETSQLGILFNSPEGMSELDNVFARVKEDIVDWISTSASSLEAEKVFAERYHYLPDNMLLSANRLQFVRTDFHAWNILPGTATANLDLRYFADDRHIPVPSITWAGLTKKNKEADSFIQWLLLPETQKLLIDRWEREGLPVFGFLNGLSSIPQVNETVLTARFPDFLNMLPENHYFAVQQYLPDRWQRIRDEVIAPWFTAAIYSPENVETFTQAYNKWDLSALQESE